MTDKPYAIHYFCFHGPLTLEKSRAALSALEHQMNNHGAPLDSPIEWWKRDGPGYPSLMVTASVGAGDEMENARFGLLTQGWVPAFFGG